MTSTSREVIRILKEAKAKIEDLSDYSIYVKTATADLRYALDNQELVDDHMRNTIA